VEISGVGLVLPLTIRASDQSTTVSLRLSRDGGVTWTEAASVPLPEKTEAGTTPVSINQDGTWEAITTDSSKIFEGNLNQPNAEPQIISPNGLQGYPIGIAYMTGSAGIALMTSDVCPSGKASCHSVEELFGSDDAGQTWSAQTGQ